MKKIIGTFLFLIVAIVQVKAANVYVGPSSKCSGTGATWAACASWEGISSFVGGNTYFLMDGTYSGKSLTKSSSPTSVTTIKKAISEEGGGTLPANVTVSGQATITGEIVFNSSYWVIDGQKGKGFSVLPPDTNPLNYGIAMTSGYRCFTINVNPTYGNITVSHIYGAQSNNDTAAGSGWFVGSGGSGWTSPTVDNVTVSYCLMVLWGQGITAQYNTWNNLVFEYNCYWTIYASSVAHANPINASYGDINNATVRYNLFYKNAGSPRGTLWGFSQVIAANNANWNGGKIYGNVFDHCWAGRSTISGNGRPNDAVYDLLVYNNTFLWTAKGYPTDSGGLIGDEYSSGNKFINNLVYNCRATVGGTSSSSYNQYINTWKQPIEPSSVIISSIPDSVDEPWKVVVSASENPFTDAVNQNYSLKANTPSGNTSLGAEFAQDALGHTRTTWTRGAFEFNGVVTHTLNASVSGSGSIAGTGINCGSDCSETFANPTSVTLTASWNAANATFSGWSGACSGTSPTCTVSVNGYTSVTASFDSLPPIVTLPTFEAEIGAINTPFAASGGLISQTGTTDIPGSGRARYRFNIPAAGDYAVSMLVTAPDGASDSFFVNIDGEPTDPEMIWDIWGPDTAVATPQNRTVTWRGTGAYNLPQFSPKVFTLTTGLHTLTIRGREANAKIDKITIAAASVSQPHPADTNIDYVISLNEATTFGACWKSNCNANATLDNASRAGYLWKGSATGQYHQLTSGCTGAACWEVGP